jgi:DNA processing protein
VSDFHSDVLPERNNFLRRNRIIAGLSEGTLIVESGSKGGALITAELASSYNREVFAVPGRVNDPVSAGCNRLIRKNIAALVETGEDIEYVLNWESSEPAREPAGYLRELVTDEEKRLLLALQKAPDTGPDILSVRTAIPLHAVMSMLIQMELKNWVTVLPGNTYRSAVRIEE